MNGEPCHGGFSEAGRPGAVRQARDEDLLGFRRICRGGNVEDDPQSRPVRMQRVACRVARARNRSGVGGRQGGQGISPPAVVSTSRSRARARSKREESRSRSSACCVSRCDRSRPTSSRVGWRRRMSSASAGLRVAPKSFIAISSALPNAETRRARDSDSVMSLPDHPIGRRCANIRASVLSQVAARPRASPSSADRKSNAASRSCEPGGSWQTMSQSVVDRTVAAACESCRFRWKDTAIPPPMQR